MYLQNLGFFKKKYALNSGYTGRVKKSVNSKILHVIEYYFGNLIFNKDV